MNKLVLSHKKKEENDVFLAREKAKHNNINGKFGKYVINDLFKYKIFNDNVEFKNGHYLLDNDNNKIPIKNGIPDFTIYSKEAWDEKEKQADYHDDEVNNEEFSEIVLRPYNYNKLHAKVWLNHLCKLLQKYENISNKPIESLKILNCGCGGGFEAQFFSENGAKVVGFDISQLRAEAAATRFELYDLEGFFYRGDATYLPFDDNTFDIVLYHDSLHHVPIEEIPKAIKEARRVTKEYIILSEAHDSPLRMFMESFGYSTSIEASGNYTFRFKKSLIQFWCYRFNMELKLYDTSFELKEHRPTIYSRKITGYMVYYIIKLFKKIIKHIGNEALIIIKKK